MQQTNKRQSLTSALTAIFVCTLIAACGGSGGGGKRSIVIGNPTEAALSVEVDGKTLTIGAQSETAIKLTPGVHTLVSPLTGPINFISYETSSTVKTLINPTFSTYVLVGGVYAVDTNAAQNFDPTNQSIVLDGVEFSGPFTKRSGLFIDGFWSYGVGQDLPKSIKRYGNEKGEIVTKLFAQRAFINYSENESNQQGRYDRDRQPPGPVAATYDSYSDMPAISDATVQAATADTRTLHQEYLATIDAAKLKALRARYFDVSAKLTKDTATLTGSLSDADEQAFNTMQRTVTDLLSTSMRVVTN